MRSALSGSNDQVMQMTNWWDVVTNGAAPQYGPLPSPQDMLVQMGYPAGTASQMVQVAQSGGTLVPGLSNTALAIGAVGLVAVLILAATK